MCFREDHKQEYSSSDCSNECFSIPPVRQRDGRLHCRLPGKRSREARLPRSGPWIHARPRPTRGSRKSRGLELYHPSMSKNSTVEEQIFICRQFFSMRLNFNRARIEASSTSYLIFYLKTVAFHIAQSIKLDSRYPNQDVYSAKLV